MIRAFKKIKETMGDLNITLGHLVLFVVLVLSSFLRFSFIFVVVVIVVIVASFLSLVTFFII